MSLLQNSNAVTPSDDGFVLKSFRFDGTSYVDRTPTAVSNRRIWTISAWVKRGNISDNAGIMGTVETGGAGSSAEQMIRLLFNANDTLGIHTCLLYTSDAADE